MVDGRVSLSLEVIVQLGWRTRRGSGEGAYVSFSVREGAAHRRQSVGAGRRGCHRLLGEGLCAFLGWVVLELGVAVGIIGGRALLISRERACYILGCMGQRLDARLGLG
jgi:hypothetical protein